jgi:guanylate kinase
MLIILSGPSGVGKSRLIELAQASFGFGLVVPLTTRKPRNGERNGIDYEFVSREAFHDLIRSDGLCAWDYTLQNYYGYRNDLARRLDFGEHLAIHALARMAVRMARSLPDVFLVFLDASSELLLEDRIDQRGSDFAEKTLRRMHWHEEKEHSPLFDWIVRDADVTDSHQMVELMGDVMARFR